MLKTKQNKSKSSKNKFIENVFIAYVLNVEESPNSRWRKAPQDVHIQRQMNTQFMRKNA